MATVSLNCPHCDRAWESRAAPGNTVKCPGCGKSKRVPAVSTQAARAAAERAWPEPGPEDEREPSGDECGSCGLPLYWTRARTNQICDNGHIALPPDNAARATDYADKPARSTEIVPADLTNDLIFLTKRRELVRACRKARDMFDTTDVKRYRGTSYNQDNADRYWDFFDLMAGQVSQFTTYEQLEEYRDKLNSAEYQPSVQTVMRQIEQELNEIAYQFNYNQPGKALSVVNNRLVQRNIDTPASSYVDAEIISDSGSASPKALTTGSKILRDIAKARSRSESFSAEYPEYDNEDDEYDYEDDEYLTGYQPSAAGFKILIGVAVLAITFYVCFVWIPDKIDDRRTHKCAYSRVMKRCQRAERSFTISTNGVSAADGCPVIAVCPAHEANVKAYMDEFMQTNKPGYHYYVMADDI